MPRHKAEVSTIVCVTMTDDVVLEAVRAHVRSQGDTRLDTNGLNTRMKLVGVVRWHWPAGPWTEFRFEQVVIPGEEV